MEKTRLSLKEWENIIQNVSECDPNDEFGNEIEIQWLDSSNEWTLCHGYECFEDGFKTEKEAWERLNEVRKNLIELISK